MRPLVKAAPSWRDAFPVLRIDQWTGFLLLVAAVVLVAAAFEFVSGASAAAPGARVLGALAYAAKLVTWSLAGGLVLWLGIKLARGEGAPEPKETVLWSACLLATAGSALRFLN